MRQASGFRCPQESRLPHRQSKTQSGRRVRLQTKCLIPHTHSALWGERGEEGRWAISAATCDISNSCAKLYARFRPCFRQYAAVIVGRHRPVLHLCAHANVNFRRPSNEQQNTTSNSAFARDSSWSTSNSINKWSILPFPWRSPSGSDFCVRLETPRSKGSAVASSTVVAALVLHYCLSC